MKTAMKPLCGAMIALMLVLTPLPAMAQKQQAPEPLSAQGVQLQKRYADTLKGLESYLNKALPPVNKSAMAAYEKALEAEAQAKSDLAAAHKGLSEIAGAQGLIGHAKGKWIGGAKKGIANAQKALKNAKTDAERNKAERDLANWQQNLKDGQDALAQRTANYERLKKNEPKLKQQKNQAEERLADSQQRIESALTQMRLDRVLKSDKLDAKLAKYAVMKQATPHRLAAFAQQSAEHRGLVDKLLSNEELMLRMAVHGGAKDGNYGRAAQIYDAILASSPAAKEAGVLNNLAMAVAMEHATPIKQSHPAAVNDGAEFVDPVERYKHYEEAYLGGELDPYFKTHNPWELRFVVNGDEPAWVAAWGREMLRNYRPDHITTKDDRWRYVALVRTCIRYGSDENKNDKPELHKYQNILMNGGVCGRRAFIGRFILRSFGVPTVAKPQRGHAALGRWTPDGWVAVLGAGWNTGWAPGREMAAADFLAMTQARDTGDDYLQVLRAQWIGLLNGETPKLGFDTGKHAAGFWNSVALNTQRALIADAKAIAAVGEELGEANESRVKYPFESAQITEKDRSVTIDKKGIITIPASATSQPTKSTGKIQFLDSVLGGKQLTYNRGGKDTDFVYTFKAPKAGKYDLTMLVATPGWKQQLHLMVNGAKQPIVLELPHTVGKWETTQGIRVDLKKGENTLHFTRNGVKQQVHAKGFTIKTLTLTPADGSIGRVGSGGPWVAE